MFYIAHPWIAVKQGLQRRISGLRAKISLVLIYLARLYC